MKTARVNVVVAAAFVVLPRAAAAQDPAPTTPSTQPAAPGQATPPAEPEKHASDAAASAATLEQTVKEQADRIKALLEAHELARAQETVKEQKSTLDRLKAVANDTKKMSPESAPTEEKRKQIQDAKSTVERVEKSSEQAAAESKKSVETATTNAGCGGSASWCLFGGATLASYSLTLATGSRSGHTSHQLLAIVVPQAGVRMTVTPQISIDLAAYTSIVSPQFQVNTISRTGSGCSKAAGTFEDKLPCEGNASLRAYAGLLLGATVGTGSSSLGILSMGLTGGIARTTQDATALAFAGVMVSTAGVYATAPLGGGK